MSGEVGRTFVVPGSLQVHVTVLLVMAEMMLYLILVVVLLMQRFENIFGGKIDRHVHFEERLSLAGNMCRAGKVSTLVCHLQG